NLWISLSLGWSLLKSALSFSVNAGWGMLSLKSPLSLKRMPGPATLPPRSASLSSAPRPSACAARAAHNEVHAKPHLTRDVRLPLGLFVELDDGDKPVHYFPVSRVVLVEEVCRSSAWDVEHLPTRSCVAPVRNGRENGH